MKIAYISNSIIPSRSANSIHVMKVCQAFAQNGHDVALFAPGIDGAQEAGIADAFAFYGVKPCFDIITLPAAKGRLGTHVYEFKAAREAAQFKPDLIYSRSAPAALFAPRHIPIVFESHAPINRNWITARLLSALMARKNLMRFVVITQALKDHFLASYPSLGSKIFVAPDAADVPSNDCPATDLQARGGSLDVGYVGHLYPGKGMEVIIPLAERCPWATFHIVGGADTDLSAWKAKAAEQCNIVFHGHQPPAIAARYVAAFDVVLLPNQRAVRVHGTRNHAPDSDIGKWTSPLKMFEYMAHGKAIVASDLPVLKEILRHGHNALLSPPDDIEAWASCLTQLNEDAQLRATLGANAKRDFLDKHTWLKRSADTIRDLPI